MRLTFKGPKFSSNSQKQNREIRKKNLLNLVKITKDTKDRHSKLNTHEILYLLKVNNMVDTTAHPRNLL